MNKIKILSVNISSGKGTVKHPVNSIAIGETGIVNDAHSGNSHRQVSMLGVESIEKFSKQAKRKFKYGEFAENITTEGFELYKSNILDRFQSGNVILEITQIGKECHNNNCFILKEIGNCVMPKEGIFCRVINGGEVKTGDEIIYNPKVFKIGIITLSDRASKGEYSDRSGPKIQELITKHFKKHNRLTEFDYYLIPDDAVLLKQKLNIYRKQNFDFIFTTGGTGIGSKDFTVDVVKPMLDKEIPGIMEFILYKYGSEKPNALISRSVAGVIKKTMIFTLPGSVKAVEEYMAEITKVLNHLILMLHDIDTH
ncbi:MAG: molybdenum cofactor synthesis domain-containing protein [Bacteroidales bacterium]|jgi:molybdenum cofactor synthesis domain-containing protein